MTLFRHLAALVLATLASAALAAGIKPFDASEFDRLAEAGKPIVVAVQAPWCPTCKAQKPIQQALMADPRFKDYTLFTVDFDNDKPLLAKFKATMQSTMIVYRGRTEEGRSVGDTTRAGIEALMLKAAG
ncbi:MAG TPA: thioredoxin family protein [Burkholderiaceae bacterium]|nr:thioredoxin family protein [Burkholderiaceae bacterium]